MSSGGASGTEYGVRSVNTVTDGMATLDGSRAASTGKTITANILVLKGGFLRGDQIPIKVTVNHTKHVRSLNGIIVTLYRQARVDMHPALPVAPNTKGDKKKKTTTTEDYYPKSLTGLGGLSLSSAGSSHLFRKDLSQSFAPLFVDPRTLTAEVKCAVRVPDEAFPTISNVPGAMISFKYYIEVIVDIQGKLTGLDRMVASAGLVNVPSATGSVGRDDAANSTFATYGGNFVDTDQIRREKGIISSLFEIVVGTKDSERNGKRKQTQAQQNSHGVHDIPVDHNRDPISAEGYDEHYYDYDENGQYYDYNYDPAYYEVPGYEQHGHGGEPSYHAPPHAADAEAGLPEKERLRRAEARLLPSQPPDTRGASSSPSDAVQPGIPPSAPMLPEDDDANPPYFSDGPSSTSAAAAHPPPPFPTSSSSAFSSRANMPPPIQQRPTRHADDDVRTTATGSSTTINTYTYHQPSAPLPIDGTEQEHLKPLPPLPPQSPSHPAGMLPDYSHSESSHVHPTDDKQEMQRRRFEMERSAPPDDWDEEGESSQHPSALPIDVHHNPDLVPSAPVLDDDDEGLVDAVRRGRSAPNDQPSNDRKSEALPVYQR
jgi:hypothetical protein